MSTLTQEDRRWLIDWLLRQSRQYQVVSKRAKRSREHPEAQRLAELSRRLWTCADALSKTTKTTMEISK
jgi:Uri superfamily endonuclease